MQHTCIREALFSVGSSQLHSRTFEFEDRQRLVIVAEQDVCSGLVPGDGTTVDLKKCPAEIETEFCLVLDGSWRQPGKDVFEGFLNPCFKVTLGRVIG